MGVVGVNDGVIVGKGEGHVGVDVGVREGRVGRGVRVGEGVERGVKVRVGTGVGVRGAGNDGR